MMKIFLLILALQNIFGVFGQTTPASYPTHTYDQFASHFRQGYGTVVVTGDQGPDYFSSLYAYPQFPHLLTPCNHMYPLSIIIGNTNTINGFSVEFSCNFEFLENSIILRNNYSTLKINSTAILEGACTYFASYLNMATFSVFQTNSYTNITYLIPGSIVSHTLSLIPTSNAILGSIPKIDWINGHFHGRRMYDLPNYLNLADDFEGTFSLPINYKIFLPDDVLEGVTVVGDANSRYYIDQFNITLTYGNHSINKETLYNDWNKKPGLSGILPIAFPTIGIIPLLIYQDWKKDENKVVPWWGATNIPIGFSPIKVLPPSNLPSSGYKGCRSNFNFYYPSPINSNFNSSNYYESLIQLKNSSNSAKYYVNSLQGIFFFNKTPYSMSGNTKDQLKDVIPPYKFLDTNFIGGCYYNGTFPLVARGDWRGFRAGSLCYVDSTENFPTVNSPFYPPPLKHSGFLTQPNHMVGILTTITQYIKYSVYGNKQQNEPNNLKPFTSKYPGIGISQSIIYSIYRPGPRLLVKSFLNVYENSDINISFDYFALGESYTWRMYGQYGKTGTSMGCRSARFVPKSSDMENIEVKWLCFKPKTSITQHQAATEFKKMVSESCEISSSVEACNTTVIGENGSWSLNIPHNSYDKKKIVMVVQNLTDLNFPKSFKTYSDAGSWFRITVLGSNPYNETWYPYSFCNVLPLLPIVPVNTPQIIKISSTIHPWDHFQNSIYSHYISTNGNTSMSVEISMASDTSLSAITPIYITAFALCQNLQTIQLSVFPDKITLSNLNMYEAIPATAEIPPIGINLRNNIDCYINFYASFSQPYIGRIGTFSSFGSSAPATPPTGVAMYSYYVAVDTPPYVGSINLFAPDSTKSVLTDAIYISVEKVIYPSETQSGVFPTVGIIATSNLIIDESTIVLLLGDSLQSVPQTIRLPAITNTWYIYFRAQTFSNSGCNIPCSPNIKASFYSHWCTTEISETQVCPKYIIKMDKKDSDDIILDAIAVALNPITYYSLNEAYQLLIGILYQPVSQDLVWKNYFGLLYSKIIGNQHIPYALDFSASKLQVLFILKRILQVANSNPDLGIDTVAPIYILANTTLNAECANNIGTKYLLLDVIDLLFSVNTFIGSTLSPSTDYMSKLLRGIESVANRFSFWNGHNQSFNYSGKYSGIEVNVKSTTFFSAYSGLQVGRMKYKYLTKLDFRELHLVNSYFMELNENYYNIQEVSVNCTSSIFTLSSTIIDSERIYSSLYELGKMDLSNLLVTSGVYIGSTSLMWCSVDYHAYNMLQQIEFSISVLTKDELDLSKMQCGAKIKDSWLTSVCKTTQKTVGQKGKEITKIDCSCNAISDYALIGHPILIKYDYTDGNYDPFSPSISKPWGGFDENLDSFVSNETLISQVINSSYSGFVSIFDIINGASAENVDFSILGNNRGLKGIYKQEGREEKKTFGIEWGINETQKIYNISNTKKSSSINNNYILWGPTKNITNSNNTLIY